MSIFLCVLSTRASLWSHLQQRASGESPAGGQASDPDTEGEAQHGSFILYQENQSKCGYYLYLSDAQHM